MSIFREVQKEISARKSFIGIKEKEQMRWQTGKISQLDFDYFQTVTRSAVENNNKHRIKQMQGTEKSFKGEATEAVQNKMPNNWIMH